MLSKDGRIEGRIHWPDGYERTPASDRDPYPGDLSPTRKESFLSIVDELERWGGVDIRISTASQHYADRPNIPHQRDNPEDVGVVAYYLREGDRADNWHAIACDRWVSQRENARAIALWAKRQRLAEKCGVTTAQSTHAAAALPSGEEEAIAVEPTREPHEILGVASDAPERVVQTAYQEAVKTAHPDQGGSASALREVREAKGAMLDGDRSE